MTRWVIIFNDSILRTRDPRSCYLGLLDLCPFTTFFPQLFYVSREPAPNRKLSSRLFNNKSASNIDIHFRTLLSSTQADSHQVFTASLIPVLNNQLKQSNTKAQGSHPANKGKARMEQPKLSCHGL